MRSARPAAALLTAALLTFALGACSPRGATRPPLRIGSLLPAPDAEPVELAAGLHVGAEPVTVAVDLDASRVTRLRLRAAGDAPLVRLSWRVDGERRFTPYRVLDFPVMASGEERLYEVDLRREPYWTGRVAELSLVCDSGSVEVTSLAGLGRGAAVRPTSLKGLTVPSLPGRAHFAVELPDGLPKTATFETWIGLLPRFDVRGVEARFRAWVEPAGGGEPVPWLDERLAGEAGGGHGWQHVERQVEVPRGGRLVLDVEGTQGGQPLPEGSAMWGAPVLVPPGHADGMNLLLVMIDTLRADVVGAYGDDGGLTPNLDALAGRAARFDEMLAPSPWTLPSTATLFTGQQPQVHGAGRRIGDFAPTALGETLPTLASTLAGHGYYTAAVYDNIYLNPSFGMERGFDEYEWVDDDDEVIVDHALARLEAIRDRRHFLFVHLFGPHQPYAPPQEACDVFARRFAPDYDGPLGCSVERREVPTLDGVVPPERDWRWIEALYRAEVAHTDQQVGRLLAALDEMGLAANTLVVVVSDHGEAFYDRLPQLAAHGYETADHGHTFFQELLHVPALIAVPGRKARVVDGPAELADVMPTVLGLLGIEEPPIGGRDLGERLAGAAPTERRTLLADRLLFGPARWSVRRGPWKLVLPAAGTAGTEADADAEGALPPGAGADDTAGAAPEPELYDLANDPGETRDVAAEHPEVVRDLRAIGERELAQRRDLRRRLLAADEDVLNAAYLEWNHITKLRTLGYLK